MNGWEVMARRNARELKDGIDVNLDVNLGMGPPPLSQLEDARSPVRSSPRLSPMLTWSGQFRRSAYGAGTIE